MLEPARFERRITATGTIVVLVAFIFFAALAYWQVFRTDLANSEGNPRILAEFNDPNRGSILDRDGNVLARSKLDGTREYSDPLAAHAVGYLDARYGTQGAELAFNDILSGRSGSGTLTDAFNAEFRRTAIRGLDLKLTIDSELQQVASDALGDRRGAVMAVDPRNGQVLAMISKPGYHPATLADDGDALLNDDSSPLLNRATQGLYPPGSTFKTVTAISALESGLYKANTSVTCPGEVVIDGFPVSCLNVPDGVGTYPFSFAFEHSVNGIFAQVGDKLGWERLLTTARKLGFGGAPAFTLPTAESQVFNPDSELTRTLLASTAFGQGELLTTPLQMLEVAATIANDGVLVTPHLGLSTVDKEGNDLDSVEDRSERRLIDSSVAKTMRDFMVGVVDSKQANGVAIPGVKVGGKTGTAESGRGTSHAWFIAFAPADDPQVAVVVVIEDGGQGGVQASPVAGTLIRAVLGK
ncbi:hypothetical protein AYO38_00910 [bacterium SCGC AG-212-C10]|nr:hypothetical protein AYO38_00910 [bacterium SCGC AG-212-C10]